MLEPQQIDPVAPIVHPVDPILGRYKFRCTFDNKGTRILMLPQSCGLELGQLLPRGFGLASAYGCPLCRRDTTMQLIEVPDPPPCPGPRGFTRIPEI